MISCHYGLFQVQCLHFCFFKFLPRYLAAYLRWCSVKYCSSKPVVENAPGFNGSTFQSHYTTEDAELVEVLRQSRESSMTPLPRATDVELQLHSAVELAVKDPNEAFHQLVQLIDAGVDLDVYNASGKTPLHLAAEKGLVVMMEQLMVAGATVNAVTRNSCGDSALHLAVRSGHEQCVKSLLENNNIDPNMKNCEGDAPIHIAVSMIALLLQNASQINNTTGGHNREIILDMLLDHNVDLGLIGADQLTPLNVMIENGLLHHVQKAITINKDCLGIVDGFGDAPMHVAARCGYFDLVAKLVEEFPSGLGMKNKSGETPAQSAACTSNLEIADYLGSFMLLSAAQSGDLHSLGMILESSNSSEYQPDAYGETAAHLAARQGHLHVIERLLSSSLDVEDIVRAKNDAGDTPLHLAAWKGHDSIIAALLNAAPCAYDAAINSFNNAGLAPVHLAAKYGHDRVLSQVCHVELGRSMIHHIRVVTTKDVRGMTALHHATIKSHEEVVQMLLFRGSNANERDVQGRTPVHWAAHVSNPSIMRFLLECGGDPLVLDVSGKTPLDLAKESGRPVFRLLTECLLFRAVESGRLADVQEAVSKIENFGENVVHVQDFAGSSALHVAARSGHADIVRWLAQKPGYATVLNDVGEQPIHIACKVGKVQCVDVLLSQDANLGCAISAEGDTPLHIAARQGFDDIINLMTGKYKIPTELPNERGNTPLHEAVCTMQLRPIKALLDAGADPNAREAYGRNSPLHLVGLWGNPGNSRQICNLLLQYGADVSCTNSDGETPLQVGTSNGNPLGFSEKKRQFDVEETLQAIEESPDTGDIDEEELDSMSVPSIALDEQEEDITSFNGLIATDKENKVILAVRAKDDGPVASPFGHIPQKHTSIGFQKFNTFKKESEGSSPGPSTSPEEFKEEQLARYTKIHKSLYIDPSQIQIHKNHILGEGSFGIVYLGMLHGNKVAIKIFKRMKSYSFRISDNENRFDSATRAFLEELEVMADLRHDNIQSVRGYTELPEGQAIVSAYYERGSLVNILQKALRNPEIAKELSWSRRLKLAKDINKGMMCMHNQTVPRVHRDLKAANCFVDERWTAYIGDFGFTCQGQSCTHDVERQAGPTNPRWLAPELLQDSEENEFSASSDVYSFGMILYELLTFQPPFRNKTIEMCYNLINGGNRPLIPDPDKLPGDKEDNRIFHESGALDLYISVMQACWSQGRNNRPDTNEIFGELRAIERCFHNSTRRSIVKNNA